MVEDLVEFLPREAGAAIAEIAGAAQGRQLLGDAFDGLLDAVDAVAGQLVWERARGEPLVHTLDRLGELDGRDRPDQDLQPPRHSLFERGLGDQDLEHGDHRGLPELLGQAFGLLEARRRGLPGWRAWPARRGRGRDQRG